MNVYQIDWKTVTAPPSFVVAQSMVEAVTCASQAEQHPVKFSGLPSGFLGVASVSLLGPLLELRPCA